MNTRDTPGGPSARTKLDIAPHSAIGKPPYRVPSMAEINQTPWNGLSVVSLFSGCGGSCLGWRMAGYRVVWASEFVEAARDSYRANAPDTVLDPRDIREVAPEDILDATGLKQGELDVLEGSPPCAAFSTAGRREAGWGTIRPYSDTRQRVDDLFHEYARILGGLQPRAFVAENVSGLVKGVAKGHFLEILAALKSCGYRVGARLLDAQWLGVPQARQRLIMIGVRDDLDTAPAFPSPLPYRYSVRDALPWVLRHGTAPPHRDFAGRDIGGTLVDSGSSACPTLTTGPNKGVGYVEALRVVHDTGGRFGRGDVTDRPCPAITVGAGGCNAGHYLVEEASDLGGYAVGAEWDRLEPGGRSARYLNLVRCHPERPCPTVTGSGGHPGTAGVTHPVQRRKFTIAELRRICGFPDDFALTGPYAKQWERLGRAVPPVMMARVAEVVRDGILLRGAG